MAGPNHTAPGQSFQRHVTSTLCTFLSSLILTYEPVPEKTNNLGSRLGATQTQKQARSSRFRI